MRTAVALFVLAMAVPAWADEHDDRVRVWLDEGTLLFRGKVVCTAPCDMRLPRDDYSVVVGGTSLGLPLYQDSAVSVRRQQRDFGVIGGLLFAISAVALIPSVVLLGQAATGCGQGGCGTGTLGAVLLPYLLLPTIFSGGGVITGAVLMFWPTHTVDVLHVEALSHATALGGAIGVRF